MVGAGECVGVGEVGEGEGKQREANGMKGNIIEYTLSDHNRTYKNRNRTNTKEEEGARLPLHARARRSTICNRFSPI